MQSFGTASVSFLSVFLSVFVQVFCICVVHGVVCGVWCGVCVWGVHLIISMHVVLMLLYACVHVSVWCVNIV